MAYSEYIFFLVGCALLMALFEQRQIHRMAVLFCIAHHQKKKFTRLQQHSSLNSHTRRENMATSTIKDRIDRTKATHREEYTFPNSASSISDHNNEYTIQHDGICFIHYRFSDMTFSQFMCFINDISVTGSDYINNYSVGNPSSGIFSFPVHRGDVVKVWFYQSYTMNWIKLNNLYVV